MLAKARQILVGELALASPVDEKKADTMMEEMMRGSMRSPPFAKAW